MVKNSKKFRIFWPTL